MFNIRGLAPATVPSKIPYVTNNIYEQDQLFFALTETWLKSHKDAELHIDGYTLFRSDRVRRKRTKRGRLSGGVAAYVHRDFAKHMEVKLQFSNGVVEILGLYSSTENLFLAIVYRQPDDIAGGFRSTATQLKDALDNLQKSINELGDPAPNLLMCGDFNLPDILWNNLGEPEVNSNELSACMLDFMNSNFLQQHITSPTHKNENTLDLVFTNNANLIHSYECRAPALASVSDHFVVECQTKLSVSTHLEEEKPERVSPLDKLNFFSNDIDWNEVSSAFNSINWNSTLKDLSPEEQLTTVMDEIHKVCEKYIPQRKSQLRSGKPKIPRDRRILMRKRKKINNQLKLKISDQRRLKLNKKLVNIEISLQESFKASKRYGEEKAIEAIKSNPKYFFSYAKKHSKLNSQIGPLLDSSNKYTPSSKNMADILSKQYQTVFSEPASHSEYKDREPTVTCSLSDIQFTEQDIIDAIDELSNNASSGPDGVAAILLKQCKKALCAPLYILWRNCLDLGITPDALKSAHIIPIFKSGHRGVAANYRPIALTSQLIKIFEKIVRNNMVSYFEENKLFNTSQHGFRRGRSCLSQLLTYFENVLTRLEENRCVDVIYLDFSKAFDKVDHLILLEKLRLLGITGKLYNWIRSFLLDRSQSVMVNGFLSDPVHVKSGVPQGSVLGPLLFLVLISDIDEHILHSFLSSFADDTRVGKSVANEEDVDKLQEDLAKIYSWASKNNMKFNEDKFELIQFGLSLLLHEKRTYFGPDGSEIKAKVHVKDLGVYISNTCNFSEHINKVCSKARDMCSWILRTFHSRTPLLMLTLWKSLVQPILDYCSQLWCPTTPGLIKQIEEIQRSFSRKIKASRSGYWERLKSFQLYSQERRRERYRILYLWKVAEKIVPPISSDSNIVKEHPRNGRTFNVPLTNNSLPAHTKRARDSSLVVHGSKLFNVLPKCVRNITNCSVLEFKRKLDDYISRIPDHPSVSGSTNANSNSLVAAVPHYEREELLLV